MKYEDLYKRVIEKKDNPNRCNPGPGLRWENLAIDEKTGFIFPFSRWMTSKHNDMRQPIHIDSARIYFRPDDVLVLVEDYKPQYGAFAPWGISGKACARIHAFSEYTYVHNLFDWYEMVPNMEINMVTGKPINARLLSDIPVDAEKMKQFNARKKEMRSQLSTLIRLDEKRIDEVKESNKKDDDRRKILVKAFTKPRSVWIPALLPHYKRFYLTCESTASRRADAFDNMMRFDQAPLLKSYGVIT